MAEAKELENGSYFMYNNELLRVTRKEVIAVGTHSHTKLKLFTSSVINKTPKTINLGHNDKVDIIEIIRKSATVLSKADGKIQMMDSMNYETLDGNVDSALYSQLNDGDEVTFIDINGNIQVLEKR